jgi:hypothetical protein
MFNTAANTYRLRVECPGIAASAVAGQFAMLRIADRVDPLLGRPLAFYDTYRSADDDTPQGERSERRFADFVYVAHGRFTTALKSLGPGERMTLWGPLGNGYGDVPTTGHLLLVAGGIGQTALLTLGRDRAAADRGPGAQHPAGGQRTIISRLPEGARPRDPPLQPPQLQGMRLGLCLSVPSTTFQAPPLHSEGDDQP